MFVPLLPGSSNNRRNLIDSASIKSVIELIRLKEKYQALNEMHQNPQLALVQLLYGKVAEESCLWVSIILYHHQC